MRQYVSSAEFKQAPTNGKAVRKEFAAPTSAMEDRRIKFTISTSRVDRSGDVIEQGGWDLTDYLRNPVVLAFHEHTLPVGKCVEIAVEDGDLKATVEFVPPDMPEIGARAEAIYRMLKMGFLSATSVGFLPLDYAMSKDEDRQWGMDFHKQVLLEFSICSIPDQPDALIEPGQRAEVQPAVDQDEPSDTKQLNTERLVRERLLRGLTINSR